MEYPNSSEKVRINSNSGLIEIIMLSGLVGSINMNDEKQTISIKAARNLTNTSLTNPQYVAGTPKMLLSLLPWRDVPGGTLRINRTKLIFKGSGKITFEYGDGGLPSVTGESLRSVSYLQNASPEVLNELANGMKIDTANLGTEVIKEGEDRDKMYILANGSARLTTVGERGEELTIRTVGPGDFFGDNELLLDDTARYTVTTLTDCVFLTLSSNDLDSIFSGNEKLKTELQKCVEESASLLEQVDEYGEHRLEIKSGHMGVEPLPSTYVDYIEEPKEIPMNNIQTVLKVHTRITDLYNNPKNQLQLQIQIAMASIYERQEWVLINDPKHGLLANINPQMRVQSRDGAPTPDDLDELISRVWKKPSFFLAHPRAIAAFERECTWRGTPPPDEVIHGQKVITWRGIPLIPSDKLEIDGATVSRDGPGTTDILLVRAGDEDVQGVVGLYQSGVPGEVSPGMSVRMMGIDDKAVASYLMTLYSNIAILTEDAVGVLEGVEVGRYHDYNTRQPKVK